MLGTLGAHGILERDRARAELVEDACGRNGLLAEGEGACEATFNSGWDAGLGNPRDLPLLASAPEDGNLQVWPSPKEPLEVARRLLRQWARVEGEPWVRYWRGDWMRRAESGAWEEVEEISVRRAVYDVLGAACYQSLDPNTGEVKLLPWTPNRARVEDVLQALSTQCLIPGHVDPPCWIQGRSFSEARGLLVCRNGVLELEGRRLGEHDPRLFTLVSVPFDYDPQAWVPGRWLQFLAELWPQDPDQIDCLQEVFGYVLSGRTNLQKIPLLVGPKRAGKGTIAGVLRALIGEGNVVGVSLNSIASNFGLQPLLDKPLALVSDARIGGDSDQLVERLLSISGEDTVTVDRKYKSSWTGRLPTRFLILSNELPRLRDTSGAMASRFVVMTLTRSWYGQENPLLLDEFLPELPGILNWALDGLDRLVKQGRFTQGEEATYARETMEDAGSPVAAFVRARCEIDLEGEVEKNELFQAYVGWCFEHGVRSSNSVWFARDLYAVVPGLRVTQRKRGDRRWRSFQGVRFREGGTGTAQVDT